MDDGEARDGFVKWPVLFRIQLGGGGLEETWHVSSGPPRETWLVDFCLILSRFLCLRSAYALHSTKGTYVVYVVFWRCRRRGSKAVGSRVKVVGFLMSRCTELFPLR